MAGRGTDIILGGNSDYMARLKVKDALLGRLVRPEDDAPASFSTNNVMEVAEGFADNIDQSSLKSYSKRIYFHASCPLVLIVCYLTCLEARSCLG